MADDNDRAIEMAALHIATIYKAIAMACAALPVPIALPSGLIKADDSMAAIRRVAEIAEDQPMPDTQQADLYTACVYWLSAIDIFGIQISDPEVDRLPQVAATLVAAESSVTDLVSWLAGEEDRED